MKKILFIILTVVVAFTIPLTSVNASTPQSSYQYGNYSLTQNGATVSIDNTTGIITVNGTTPSVTTFTLPSLYTLSALGTKLDETKTYQVIYEYISGDVSSGTVTVIETGNITNGIILLGITPSNYNMTAGYTLFPNGASMHNIKMNSSTTANNLKYKIHYIEIENTTAGSIDFFDNLESFSSSGASFSFEDSNTITINGTPAGSHLVDFTNRINPDLLNSSKVYLFTFEYVSGTITSPTATISLKLINTSGAFMQNSVNSSTYNFTRAIAFKDINQVIIGESAGRTYTNFKYKIHVQELSLYQDEIAVSISLFTNYSNTSGGLSINIENGNEVTVNGTAASAVTFSSLLPSIQNIENSKEYLFTYHYLSGTTTSTGFTPLAVNGAMYQIVLSSSNYEADSPSKLIPWSASITGFGMSFSPGIYDNLKFRLDVEELTEYFIVTFETNGGTPIGSQVVQSGGFALLPEAPTKPGYDFQYWRDSLEVTPPFFFDTPITGNITLYAVWTENGNAVYTITFVSNGGSAINNYTWEESTQLVAPTNPTRNGYTFSGWYTDIGLSELFDFEEDLPESDLTLYAKWVPVSGGGNPVVPDAEVAADIWLYVGIGVLVIIAVAAGLSSKGSKKK